MIQEMAGRRGGGRGAVDETLGVLVVGGGQNAGAVGPDGGGVAVWCTSAGV